MFRTLVRMLEWMNAVDARRRAREARRDARATDREVPIPRLVDDASMALRLAYPSLAGREADDAQRAAAFDRGRIGAGKVSGDELVKLALARIPMTSQELAAHLQLPLATFGRYYALPETMPLAVRGQIASVLKACHPAHGPVAEALTLQTNDDLGAIALAVHAALVDAGLAPDEVRTVEAWFAAQEHEGAPLTAWLVNQAAPREALATARAAADAAVTRRRETREAGIR